MGVMFSLVACQSGGIIPEAQALTLEEAKDVALSHAFIKEEEAEFIAQEFIEAEDYYFFIVKKDDNNFVYKIDAKTGKILLSSDQETDESLVQHKESVKDDKEDDKEDDKDDDKKTVKDTAQNALSSTPKTPVKTEVKPATPKESETLKNISKEKAVELALANAGLTRNQISELEVEEKFEKNRKVYEVEFDAGQYDYEYKFAIADGTLVKKDVDYEGSLNNSNPLTIAGAKEKALARVQGANDNHIRIKEDEDDGRIEYEGKIIYGNYEYEFEIDAASGIFLEWEQEILY